MAYVDASENGLRERKLAILKRVSPSSERIVDNLPRLGVWLIPAPFH